jgi:hypothetical protein
VGIRRHHDRDAGLDAQPDVLALEVEAVGEPVDLERRSRLERDLDDALEVDRVRRPPSDEPPGRVAERAHGRVAQRLDDPRRQHLPLLALPGVDASRDPVELGKHVVGQVE